MTGQVAEAEAALYMNVHIRLQQVQEFRSMSVQVQEVITDQVGHKDLHLVIQVHLLDLLL
jgi:hypothetical protein